MDRKITAPKNKLFLPFKAFEYLDIFPYSIAFLLLCGSVYILYAFLAISHVLQHV